METITLKDLNEMSGQELKDLAKKMNVKIAPNAGEEVVRDAIFVENAKREQRLKARATAELEQEAVSKLDLSNQAGARPLPEDVAILASKRFYVKFINLEQPADGPEPGATAEFTKGTFGFALYDGRIHCLPGALLAESIEQVPQVLEALTTFFRNAGLPLAKTPRVPGAGDMARSVIARLSIMGQIAVDKTRQVNTSATYPIFSDVKLPTGEQVSRLTAVRKRWDLQVIGEAAPDTPFGLVTDPQEIDNARNSQLVPLG